MRQETAERRIRTLQKQFLSDIEAHPVLHAMGARDFNDLRKRVFRGTFAAYRLGVLGFDRVSYDENAPSLSRFFFGWLTDHESVRTLPLQMRLDVTEMCLRVALEAHRLGALVAYAREQTAEGPA